MRAVVITLIAMLVFGGGYGPTLAQPRVDLLIHMTGSLAGWAFRMPLEGGDKELLHTTDGGVRWALESSGTSHALNRLFFVDQNHGWVVGFGGTILKYGQSQAPKLKS